MRAYGNRVSVVNAGIGGNRILTPESYPPPQPFAGGPSALQRLDRDLFGLSGLSAVVLLEGINDISAGASADAIIAGMKELVSRVKAKGHQDCRRDDHAVAHGQRQLRHA